MTTVFSSAASSSCSPTPTATFWSSISSGAARSVRTAPERERARALLEDDVRNINLEKRFIVEPDEPAIDYIHLDDAGNLWIQHGRSWRGREPGVLVVFDVLDPSGQLAREVEVRGPGNLANDVVWILDEGHFALVIGGNGGTRALDESQDTGEPVQVVMLEAGSPHPSFAGK